MGTLHNIADFIGISQGVRNRIVSRWRAFTRWTPPYFQPITKWCLNTEPRDVKITLSLTSYPGRIKSVHRVITTLLNQTVKPDRVILWLGEEKFPRRERELPRRLLRLEKYGLTIEWCKDMRSYTKLLPSLNAYPDDIIVTIDDDTFYPPELIEMAFASYKETPGSVHSLITMSVEKDSKGELTQYTSWKHCLARGRLSYATVLLGYGGVLYPPRIFTKEVFNEEAFKKIAPTTDDLWFWAMAVLAGARIKTVLGGGGIQCGDPCAATSDALMNSNLASPSGNDGQLGAILNKYPLVRERLYKDLILENGDSQWQ